MKRSLLLAGLLASALVLGQTTWVDVTGNLRITQFTNLDVTAVEGGRRAVAAGSPAKLEQFAQGMTIWAPSMEATFRDGEGGGSEIRSAVLKGDVRIQVDRAAAEKAMAEREKRAAKPGDQGLVEITTPELTLEATKGVAEVEVPQPLTAVFRSEAVRSEGGQTIPVRNDLRLEGSRATLWLALTTVPQPLQRGRVSGGVTLRVARTDLNVAALQSTFEASGTEAEFDLTASPAWIELRGNVEISGTQNALNGRARGDRARLELAPDLSLRGFTLTGAPTRSEVQRPGGGR